MGFLRQSPGGITEEAYKCKYGKLCESMFCNYNHEPENDKEQSYVGQLCLMLNLVRLYMLMSKMTWNMKIMFLIQFFLFPLKTTSFLVLTLLNVK